ncbi:unnamed protein product [Brachionus calyciflorus]|uniref:Ubiquitin carboxyl-terminal hydrolase n=1 Tax=Brachionus calyciflorus TaxID=104777 RepID=A0A813NGL9_9BILA|nr:unnamed protein product [Brachionus calyciflorus]
MTSPINEARWLPLESNPEFISKYVNNIGVETDKYEFVDIYGLEPELLQMVPRPCIAVLLLFPVTKIYQEFRNKQVEECKNLARKISESIFYTKQTVQNACGTVALIHALANNKTALNIDMEKAFGKYLKATESMTPEESAEYLKTDDGITNAHQESAVEGQTEAPNLEECVDLHFIAFVEKDGDLYELDGALGQPLNHGPTGGDLLEAFSNYFKNLIELNPDENRFNLIGLSAKID